MVNVDAEYFPKQQLRVLGMTLRVLLRPGIPHPNIKVAVGAKHQTAAVMHVGHGIQLQDEPGGTTRVATQIFRSDSLQHQRRELATFNNVFHVVVLPIDRKLRMKRQPEQAARSRRKGARVKERLLFRRGRQGAPPNPAGLVLHDREGVRQPEDRAEPDRVLETPLQGNTGANSTAGESAGITSGMPSSVS